LPTAGGSSHDFDCGWVGRPFSARGPGVKQVSDLKGKKVGVGLIGNSEDRFFTMLSSAAGSRVNTLPADETKNELEQRWSSR
jgi:hypothetical protein